MGHPEPSFSALAVCASEVCDQTIAAAASRAMVFGRGLPDGALERILAMSRFLRRSEDGYIEAAPRFFPEAFGAAGALSLELSLMELRSERLEDGFWGQALLLTVWRPEGRGTESYWSQDEEGRAGSALEIIRPIAQALLPTWGRALGLGEALCEEEEDRYRPEWAESRALDLLTEEGGRRIRALKESARLGGALARAAAGKPRGI